MDDLRIPVASKEAIIGFPGGVQVAGLVFIPAAAPDHDGAMRLVEWLNAEEEFFPFKAHGEENSALVNKRNVLSLTAYHESDGVDGDDDVAIDIDRRGVSVETVHGSFEGQMVIDMPNNRHRVLDVLNDGRRFIFLLDSGKEIHINKNFITKATETA